MLQKEEWIQKCNQVCGPVQNPLHDESSIRVPHRLELVRDRPGKVSFEYTVPEHRVVPVVRDGLADQSIQKYCSHQTTT